MPDFTFSNPIEPSTLVAHIDGNPVDILDVSPPHTDGWRHVFLRNGKGGKTFGSSIRVGPDGKSLRLPARHYVLKRAVAGATAEPLAEVQTAPRSARSRYASAPLTAPSPGGYDRGLGRYVLWSGEIAYIEDLVVSSNRRFMFRIKATSTMENIVMEEWSSQGYWRSTQIRIPANGCHDNDATHAWTIRSATREDILRLDPYNAIDWNIVSTECRERLGFSGGASAVANRTYTLAESGDVVTIGDICVGATGSLFKIMPAWNAYHENDINIKMISETEITGFTASQYITGINGRATFNEHTNQFTLVRLARPHEVPTSFPLSELPEGFRERVSLLRNVGLNGSDASTTLANGQTVYVGDMVKTGVGRTEKISIVLSIYSGRPFRSGVIGRMYYSPARFDSSGLTATRFQNFGCICAINGASDIENGGEEFQINCLATSAEIATVQRSAFARISSIEAR